MIENFPSVAKHFFFYFCSTLLKIFLFFLTKTELNSPSSLLRLLFVFFQGLHLKSVYWQLLICLNKVAIRN